MKALPRGSATSFSPVNLLVTKGEDYIVRACISTACVAMKNDFDNSYKYVIGVAIISPKFTVNVMKSAPAGSLG